MSKKTLIESKCAQLKQIKENEALRETEKELDRMWEDMMNRENQSKVREDTKFDTFQT